MKTADAARLVTSRTGHVVEPPLKARNGADILQRHAAFVGLLQGGDDVGVQGAEVYVLPAVVPPQEKDTLLRETIVYLTCLHETGHALGLAHTAAFGDIMYSFQYGGDIPEYFARYRRQLSGRDDIRKHSGMSDQDRKRLRALFR